MRPRSCAFVFNSVPVRVDKAVRASKQWALISSSLNTKWVRGDSGSELKNSPPITILKRLDKYFTKRTLRYLQTAKSQSR